ncbi:MAG TPA: class I SAM-dependent methyltransferase [Gemmatimonadales bacterium]|nr:class I SAM-dependent methyltransferase [Gemmatimonadales bacterium]
MPELIERNRRMFVRDNLTFRAIDAVTDPLPPGDLVIVRQVFQHLRNDQIQAILRKFARYRTWIISEHGPSSSFVPNLDILSGPDTRLSVGSGVVITQEPFPVRPRHSQVLSEVHVKGGVIRTDDLFVSVVICGFRRVDLACASGSGRIETHGSVRVEFESTMAVRTARIRLKA